MQEPWISPWLRVRSYLHGAHTSTVRKYGDVLVTLRADITDSLQDTIAVCHQNGYGSADGYGSVDEGRGKHERRASYDGHWASFYLGNEGDTDRKDGVPNLVGRPDVDIRKG